MENIEYLQRVVEMDAPDADVALPGGINKRSCRVLKSMFSDTPHVSEREKNGYPCATCRYAGPDGKVHTHAKTIHISEEQQMMGLESDRKHVVARCVEDFYARNHHQNTM